MPRKYIPCGPSPYYAAGVGTRRHPSTSFKNHRVVKPLDPPSPTPTRSASELLEFTESITLPGELEGRVPIYDNCEEIRDKLRQFLSERRWASVTPEKLRKAFGKGCWNKTYFEWFMQLKGPQMGRRNRIYYAAYVFFEKLRIAEGAEKTEARLRAESLFGEEGRVPEGSWGSLTLLEAGGGEA